jgi:cytidylate kinase
VDGRDIGTVVFPDAPLKIYLTAHADERARRRLTQTGEAADATRVARESAVLSARDALDAGRSIAPLRAADDAITLDTTALTLSEQVNQIVALARTRFPE